MRSTDIYAHWKKRPFRPFRMHISDGSHYDIRHPEMILVGRTDIVLGLTDGTTEPVEEWIFVDPVHVTRIERIDGIKKHPKKNGRKR